MLALRSIARRVLQLTAEERELAREIETIIRRLAPQLLEQPGVGPHAAAQLVLSWSHRGRIGSDRGFEQWGEILGDAMVAAALIDRLIHHATMLTLKGKSYRLRERGTGVAPAAQAPPLRDSA
jgi:IstB-like ATP binding protein